MANVKITDLNQDTAPASTDVLPFVDVSSDETKKVTVEDLLESAGDGAAATPAFSFESDKSVGMWRPGSEQLAFSTSGTTRLFIDSSGNIGVNTTNPGAYVHAHGSAGDHFRASNGSNNISILCDGTNGYLKSTGPVFYRAGSTTHIFQNADGTSEAMRTLSGGGLTFNGDTATANALDDYEEGTWTPSVEFGGATTGITYNARQGFYVKIGKVVHVWLYFNLSNKGSATGGATVAGLPFTSEDFNVAALTTWPGSKPSRRQNEFSSDFAMAVLENNSEVGITNGAGSAVTDSTFSNGTIIECALCYRAA